MFLQQATRVAICGVDFKPRPHMVAWFIRAFKRLGCNVAYVAANEDADIAVLAEEFDPTWQTPTVRMQSRNGGRPGLGSVCGSASPVLGGDPDFVVMINCGDDWTVVNDGSAPFAYVWREGNPHEFPMVGSAAGKAPVFCCMINKPSQWPSNCRFMPFAVDRAFLGGPVFADRKTDFIYTGRQRGGVYGEWQQQFAAREMIAGLHEYLFPYAGYAQRMRDAKVTTAVHSSTYLASRGLEAMAMGAVTFWDDGETLRRAGGLVANRDYLVCASSPAADGDMTPRLDYDAVADLCRDKDHWTYVSLNGRKAIRDGHLYEHRATTIAESLGFKLPLTPEEGALFSPLDFT